MFVLLLVHGKLTAGIFCNASCISWLEGNQNKTTPFLCHVRYRERGGHGICGSSWGAHISPLGVGVVPYSRGWKFIFFFHYGLLDYFWNPDFSEPWQTSQNTADVLYLLDMVPLNNILNHTKSQFVFHPSHATSPSPSTASSWFDSTHYQCLECEADFLTKIRRSACLLTVIAQGSARKLWYICSIMRTLWKRPGCAPDPPSLRMWMSNMSFSEWGHVWTLCMSSHQNAHHCHRPT